MTVQIPADEDLAQSLSGGAAGTALLQVELALTGSGTWDDARQAISRAAAEPIDASPSGCLIHGAPALAFVLHAAQADGRARYQDAAEKLAGPVTGLARLRLAQARARTRSGRLGTFREYDLFYGLTGIGMVLLRTAPASDTLAAVLTYLTRMATQPTTLAGIQVPGWWANRDPDPLHPTPGGHANLGMAHGVAVIFRVKSPMRLCAAAGGCYGVKAHEAHWSLAGAAGGPRLRQHAHGLGGPGR